MSAYRSPSRAGSPPPLPRRAPPGPPLLSSAWGPSVAPTVRRPRGCTPQAAGCPHRRAAAGSPSRSRSHWTDEGTEAGARERGASGSAGGSPHPPARAPPIGGAAALSLRCFQPVTAPPQPCCTPSLRPLPHTHFPSPADPQLPPHHQAHILSSPLLPHYHTGAPVAKRSSCTLSAWAHPPTRYPIPHAPQLQSPMLSDPPPSISNTHAWISFAHTCLTHGRVPDRHASLSNSCVCVTRVCLLHACMSATRVSITHASLSHMCHTRVSRITGVTVPHTLNLSPRVTSNNFIVPCTPDPPSLWA